MLLCLFLGPGALRITCAPASAMSVLGAVASPEFSILTGFGTAKKRVVHQHHPGHSGLLSIRLVKTRGYEILNTENAFDRRTTPADLNPARARFQIRLDIGDLNLREMQGPQGFR